MNQLSPEARRLIAETKTLDDPSPAQRAQLRARLDASWAGVAASPRQAHAARAVYTKLWVASTLSAVVLSYWAFQAWHERRPQPASVASISVASGAAAANKVHSSPESLPLMAAQAPVSIETPPLPTRPSSPAPRRSEPRPRPHRKTAIDPPPPAADAPALSVPSQVAAPLSKPNAPVAPDTRVYMAAPVETSPELAHTREQGLAPDPIDAELVLLGAAQEALQAGRPTQALALAQQHAFRFPRGALANERRAVHALSLCALGRRAAARQVAADLAHSAPDAPVRKRIEADCGF